MTIRYECQECGSTLKIKDELAGKDGHCPKCKATFTIPGPEDEQEEHLSLGIDSEAEFVPPPPPARSARKKGGGDAVEQSSRSMDAYAELLKSTSNTAGDLLKQAAASSKNKKSQKLFGLEDPDRPEGARVDVAETLKYVTVNIVGPIVGVIVVVFAVYLLSFAVLGDKAKLPKLGLVSGTITMDGHPFANANVVFEPEPLKNAAPVNVSQSVAKTDPQGKYTLTYVQQIKGAVVGNQIVHVTGFVTLDQAGTPTLTPIKRDEKREVKPGRQTMDFSFQSAAPQN